VRRLPPHARLPPWTGTSVDLPDNLEGDFDFIAEAHPFAWIFDDDQAATGLRIDYLHEHGRDLPERVAAACAGRRPAAAAVLAQGVQGLGWEQESSEEDP